MVKAEVKLILLHISSLVYAPITVYCTSNMFLHCLTSSTTTASYYF
jgi:hypothetical protein